MWAVAMSCTVANKRINNNKKDNPSLTGIDNHVIIRLETSNPYAWKNDLRITSLVSIINNPTKIDS